MIIPFLLFLMLSDDKVAKPAPEAKKLEFNAECSRKPKTAEEAKAPLSPERERARQLLEGVVAEAEAAEPEMKAYLRMRLARTIGDCAGNQDLAQDYFRKALEASRELSDDRNFRTSLQVSIARRLPPETVREHFPDFSEKGRLDLAQNLGSALLRSGRQEDAVALFESFADAQQFPMSAAGRLIKELPEDARIERHRIFVAAMQSSRLETKAQGGFYDIAALLGDVAGSLTPEETLDAAEQLLTRAKDSKQTMGFSANGKVLEFPSLYDYRLFQLIPVIRKLDERRAERLLNDAPFVRATLQDHPQGMEELRNSTAVGMTTWSRPDGKAMPADAVTAQAAQGTLMGMLQENKPKDAFDYAMNVATTPDLRLMMLQNVAQHALLMKDFKLSKEALQAALKFFDQVKPRMALLGANRGCDIWLSLGEKDQCDPLLREAAKKVKALYEMEKSGTESNAAFIGYWASLENSEELAYYRCKVDPHVESFEPADDAFRPTVKLAEARCLLGLSTDRWSPQSIPQDPNASRGMQPAFF
jgi:hypothetical protein